MRDPIPGYTRARADDVSTSQIAARMLDARRVYQLIVEGMASLPEGGTHHEVAAASRVTTAQAHKRLPELARLGAVRRLETTRKGPSNRPCHVWVLA